MKLIILDRDGVINFDSDEYIKKPEEWRALPGSLEAIALLKQHDYTVVIATNQSGIGRGYYTEATLQAIHAKMQTALTAHNSQIDAIFYCPHHPDDHCDCRKPKPGLLYQIQAHFACDLHAVPFVGDSVRDLQAGLKAGCQAILVRTGRGQKAIDDNRVPPGTLIFDDLYQVASHLCQP